MSGSAGELFMNKIKIYVMVVCVIVILLFTSSAGGQNSSDTRIIIGMDSMDSKPVLTDAIVKLNGAVISEIPQLNAIVIEIPKVKYAALKLDPVVITQARYMELDVMVTIPPFQAVEAPIESLQTYPNDPYYPDQWGLPMIEADYAWDVLTGNRSTIVAVIDTGADYTHNDLGAVDSLIGWDFVNNDNDAMDDNGHGTHVSGIIAATINNSEGVAGIASGITIMPVKVLNAQGTGWTSDIARGISFAADNGAKIISMSLGSWTSTRTLEDATRYAVYNKGCLLFAASGNDGLRLKTYPAAYNWVAAVGAVGHDKNRAWYSNYGDFVDLVAPGGSSDGTASHDIISTLPGNRYGYSAGTSMATPHASGVAALYWSYKPTFTNVEVARAMINNADDLGTPGKDIYYGYGLVDAWPANG